MAEKGAMAGAFELTPGLRDSLGLRDREYVVKDPVEIVVETKGGARLKPPQEIRERIVRCRDCKHGEPFGDSGRHAGMIDCMRLSRWDYYDDVPGCWPVEPNGFCAWGEERDE